MNELTPQAATPSDADAKTVQAVLRQVQETTQGLTGAPGIKALVRRFGEAAAKHFGIARLALVKVQGKGGKLTLKRRTVAIDGLETFTDEDLELLGAELSGAAGRLAEMGEGLTHWSVGGRELALTSIDDPQAKEGSLVVWEAKPQDVTQGLLLDHMVRVMQGESRWLKKLDRTQAMLYKDDLTGLYNYRYLEIALDGELRRADRFQTQFCLLFIDLDGFKPINDQHGHVAGSSVLKQVADVLRDAVREIDVPIRYGGDEFVVVLLGASCAKGVLAAERVRRRIEQKQFQLEGGQTARVTASIGVAAYPDHGRDRETLLKLADETMYDSKRNGKNRVTVAPGERTV